MDFEISKLELKFKSKSIKSCSKNKYDDYLNFKKDLIIFNNKNKIMPIDKNEKNYQRTKYGRLKNLMEEFMFEFFYVN